MPYIFVVDKTNLRKCLESYLFGVPDTARAYSQILSIKKGEMLFLYEYGPRRVHGIYKAKSEPFTERDPSRGPWKGRKRDLDAKYYPHRIEIEIKQYYPTGVDITKIEKSELGIDRRSFNGKSCMYISDRQAEKIMELLKSVNIGEPSQFCAGARWDSDKRTVTLAELKGGKEEKLQVLVQQNIEKLRKLGLEIEVLDSYFNITECMSCKAMGILDYAGQIDILGKDISGNFIVTELKAEAAQKAIVKQLENYALVARKTIAKQENVGVSPAIICKSASNRLIRYLQQKKIATFEHCTDFESYIEFERLT
ncbi:MAG: endonuclease NucS [Candidatus Hodarchaeaceae archaeon]|nr:endonuclease NucS [Candidatus Hodarchaeaceae archaeon]